MRRQVVLLRVRVSSRRSSGRPSGLRVELGDDRVRDRLEVLELLLQVLLGRVGVVVDPLERLLDGLGDLIVSLSSSLIFPPSFSLSSSWLRML